MQVLQTTLRPAAGFPASLYLQQKRRRTLGALRFRPDGAGLGIALDKGETLSTDTFFGSFYAGYWGAFSTVTRLAAVVAFRGAGQVRVYEDASSEPEPGYEPGRTAGAVLLCQYDLDTPVTQRFLIAFEASGLQGGAGQDARASRIYLEIEAEKPCEIDAIDFVTEDADPRDISLSIGISTFNDSESRINGLLPAVMRMADADPAIRAVHLVNHGPAFHDAAVLAALNSAKLHQAAPASGTEPGGLAQTIVAARGNGLGCTHHLLLADDAVLDERLIQRAVQFLRFARTGTILTGPTLDATNPTLLLGAGAVIGASGTFRQAGAGTDLARTGPARTGLARTDLARTGLAKADLSTSDLANSDVAKSDTRQTFNAPQPIDLPCWWFCFLPLDSATQTDLPQRPLLRGDDFAYYRDQSRLGATGLCLPGIGIWRSPSLVLPHDEQSGRAGTIALGNRYLPPHDPASDEHATHLHLVQSTLFPLNDLPEAMYLRVTPARNRGGLLPRVTRSGSEAIRLDARDILTTDTFFGSFYRAYWHAYAGLSDIAIAVELNGAATVKVFEDAGRGAILLAEERFHTTVPRRFLMDVIPTVLHLTPGETESRPSRIYIEVLAEKTTDVHAIDYMSTQAPLRRATLSIGLCTFNQETYFARTLTRVAKLVAGSDAIRAVHVVNQGTAFKSETIRTLLTSPRIVAVDQRNLGGCGGFTRSLVEELAASEPASHHLMMDDDIVLDERMILRALRFLDYADRDVALGAGMLDSMRPSVMYEAGAFLRRDNTIHPYCHNVDLSDPGRLWYFNTPVKTDYNAWWFCILPVERSRELALPAPVFIRGDDFEYGQRLARAGVPTVTLPGIGVWHEPFYAKPTGWQNYYDLRNRLIFGATYGDKVRQLSLAHVLGLITTAILTHNYMTAELRIKAVNDFLLGPDRLFGTDPEKIHKSVMELAKRDAPERLDDSWKLVKLSTGKPQKVSMRGLAKQQLSSMMRTGFGLHGSGGETVLIDADAHPGNTAGKGYVLSNGPRSYHLRFAPKRWRMWGLMTRAALLAWRYRSRRVSVGAVWADKIAAFRQPEWWAGTFGPAPAAAPSAGDKR